MSNTKKVLLIGWDAADWKVINPLIDAGKMPTLKRLIEGGTMGNMATLSPALSPMLWTSIATGKRPHKHGIYGFIEPTQNGKAVRPMTNRSRRCKAIWNILNQQDLESIVVGWWPSHPAEPINGVMVSDLFHKAPKNPSQKRKVTPKSVHPAALAEEMESLVVHPMELGVEHILPFIPNAKDVDQDSDSRISACLRLLAECSTNHNIATHLLETQPWDFAAIYYDSIDHFSHVFMRYHPPKQKQITEQDFHFYQHAVSMAYIFHDLMLERLLELADEETTVILMSDHGFHPDHLRPKSIPTEPAGPALEHRDYGIFAIKGPNIKKDQLTHGANLLDITPTILSLFGLPVAEDMDGKVLFDVFESVQKAETIPTWEEVIGPDGQHPANEDVDIDEAGEALEQLIALGYIERPKDDAREAVADCQCELDYNLGRALMDAGMHGDALPLLVRLYEDYPLEFRFGIQLANCLRALDRNRDLQNLINDLNSRWRLAATEAKLRIAQVAKIAKKRKEHWLELKKIDEENKTKGSEQPIPPLARRAPNGRPDLFSAEESYTIRKLKAVARGNPQTLDFLAATVAMSQDNFAAALEHMQNAEKTASQSSGFQYQLGNVYLGLKRYTDAQRSFMKALEFDETNANALLGLCRVNQELGQDQNAVEYGKQAIGLKFHFPTAHYFFARAKMSCQENIDSVISSLETALSQNPNFPEAHQFLARIYSDKKPDQNKAKFHSDAANDLLVDRGDTMESAEVLVFSKVETIDFSKILPSVPDLEAETRNQFLPCLAQEPMREANKVDKQEIIIVSGLPRSGTSVMMQMLVSGGLQPFTDDQRAADENNPNGYYEADIVKQLARKNDWLPQAEGKVVKVVAPLIPFLPQNCKYKVVFMDRTADEVVESQQKMLQRLDAKGGEISPERLKEVFEQQALFAIEVLKKHNIPFVRISYQDVIQEPSKVAKEVSGFLEMSMQVAKMAGVVDPLLYRQRAKKAH